MATRITSAGPRPKDRRRRRSTRTGAVALEPADAPLEVVEPALRADRRRPRRARRRRPRTTAVSSVVGRGNASAPRPSGERAQRVADAACPRRAARRDAHARRRRAERERRVVRVGLAAHRGLVLERVVRGPGARAPPATRRTSPPASPQARPFRSTWAGRPEREVEALDRVPAAQRLELVPSARRGRPRRARRPATRDGRPSGTAATGSRGSLIGAVGREPVASSAPGTAGRRRRRGRSGGRTTGRSRIAAGRRPAPPAASRRAATRTRRRRR